MVLLTARVHSCLSYHLDIAKRAGAFLGDAARPKSPRLDVDWAGP
jgi:hypothetical protein